MSLKPDATQADLRVCLLTTLRPFKQLGIQISEAAWLLRKMSFHFAGSLPSQGALQYFWCSDTVCVHRLQITTLSVHDVPVCASETFTEHLKPRDQSNPMCLAEFSATDKTLQGTSYCRQGKVAGALKILFVSTFSLPQPWNARPKPELRYRVTPK